MLYKTSQNLMERLCYEQVVSARIEEEQKVLLELEDIKNWRNWYLYVSSQGKKKQRNTMRGRKQPELLIYYCAFFISHW